MEGWTITDEGTKHTYTFPYYVLNSGSTVTLYTGNGTDNGNILFWNSGSFIWNNEGDTAYLYNNQGQLVSTKTGTDSTTATAAFATASTASATASTASDTTSQTTTPTITWGNPSDITIGTALNGTQLNAAASVPGNFTYNPAEGTVLSIGTQTLHVDFTPTDTVNYTTASKDVTIIVLATTSNAAKTESTTYTTATPALNGTQLNSVASVPCNCTYSRAAGNFSAERSWKSRVDFTSTDTANYTTTAPENVTINCFSGTQRISSDHIKNRNINSYNSNNQNGSYDQSNDIEFRKGRMWKTYQ
jgi:hypothetical protein